MNSILQMFNDPYIQEQARRAQEAQKEHQKQVENVRKSAHKLKDYLDSLDDIMTALSSVWNHCKA